MCIRGEYNNYKIESHTQWDEQQESTMGDRCKSSKQNHISRVVTSRMAGKAPVDVWIVKQEQLNKCLR